MKTTIILLLALVAGACTAAAKPTDEQIEAAAADPAKVVDILKASGTDQEAIDAVFAVITKVGASTLSVDQKREHAALLVAHMIIANPARSPVLMAILAGRVEAALLPLISAASSLASGTYSKVILDAIVVAVQGSDEAVAAVREAARNPVKELGEDVARKIKDLPIPVVPLDPATTGITILPVAKPIPEGPGEGRPRVGPRYRGQ